MKAQQAPNLSLIKQSKNGDLIQISGQMDTFTSIAISSLKNSLFKALKEDKEILKNFIESEKHRVSHK